MNKIFVGTLYCGENDFKFCLDSISQQAGVEIKHCIIENLPEAAAHNKLWDSWRSVQKDFDIFVKIDADTVLVHENILYEICKVFSSNNRITGMQCPLKDYFTNEFINGLNCFSNKVQFNNTKNELYCDRNIDTNHDIVIKSEAVPNNLRPAGYHCYYASDIQAFHFGLHRQLKNQNETIMKVYEAWKKSNHDYLRTYVLLGAKFAKQFQGTNQFNYNDLKFQKTFEECKNNFSELKRLL